MIFLKLFIVKMYKVRICIFYLLTLFICICSCMAQKHPHVFKGTNYYLDLSGNNQSTGTKNSPWKTIQKLNTIKLKAGDSVLFKGGQIFNGSLLLDSINQGVVDIPIVISTYGKGKAVINGGNEFAIQILNSKLITVKKLQLIGSGRKNGNATDGITISHCADIQVDDLDVSGFRNAGVFIYASTNIKVTGVNAHDNGFAGISILGAYQLKQSCNNIYIGYCNAENNPGNPVILDNQSGNGIIAGNCSKLKIEYCTATNNGWDMPRIGNGPVGIWCYEADSVLIQHCISYRNKTSIGGGDGGGFDLDGGVTNSIIQYCLSYQNQGSGFGIFQYAGASNWYNNIIRFNISENDGSVSEAGAGIYIWNSSRDSTQFKNCTFYNNTIYNIKGAAISYATQSERKGFLFYNNIFVAGDNLLKGKKATDIFLANDLWSLKNKFNIGGVTEFDKWAKINGQEILDRNVVGLNIDPAFKNTVGSTLTDCSKLKFFDAYKIAENSVLGEAGVDLHDLYGIETGGLDFNGNPAPIKGIGACL